jgi:cytochrome c oxidase assembly protein subunit 15
VFHLPLLVAVAHNLGGAALLLTLVLINYRLRSRLWLRAAVSDVPRGFAAIPSK